MTSITPSGSTLLRIYRPRVIVPAIYLPGHPPDTYNPLVEAILPAVDDDALMAVLTTMPLYDPSHRYIESHNRIDRIFKARMFFACLPETVNVAQTVLRAIRLGYEGRDWDPRTFWPRTDAMEDDLQASYMCNGFQDDLLVEGVGIFGTSGIGKSRTLRRALSLLPQAIEHSDYRGIPMGIHQLTYLLLECPTDGSQKTLCLDILEAVDDILGTSYLTWYGRNGAASVNQMIGKVGRLARIHFLGALALDETQLLKEMLRGDPTAFLNFLVRLSNCARIPIILVGTNKARSLISSRGRTARRFTALGDITWNQLKRGTSWRVFMKALWRYYYLQHDQPVHDSPGFEELSAVLYEETQGITHFAVTLFLLAQILAIQSGEERLTAQTVSVAAVSLLRPARPLLLALKTGDLQALERIDDIGISDLEDFVDQATDDYVKYLDAIDTNDDRLDGSEQLANDTVDALSEAAQSASFATSVSAAATPVPGVTTLPPTSAIAAPSPAPKRPRRAPGVAQRDSSKPTPSPLRKLARIKANGAARNMGPYEALMRAGYIKAADEFIPEGASA